MRLGFSPATLVRDRRRRLRSRSALPVFATIFISMFLHGGLLHIAGNMLYLWIFGNNIEDAMGHARFLSSISSAASRPR